MFGMAIRRTSPSRCCLWQSLIAFCCIAGCTRSGTDSDRAPAAQTVVEAGANRHIDSCPAPKTCTGDANDLDHFYTIARLATSYEAIGDFPKALEKWQQAQILVTKDFPEYSWLLKSVDVQVLRLKRAATFSDPEKSLSNRLIQARSDLKNLVAVMDRDAVARQAAVVRELTAQLWGSEDAAYVDYLVGLAECHLCMKDFAQANNTASEALAIQKRVFGDANPLYADILEILGSVELEREDYVAAKRLFMRSREIKDRLFGQTSRYTGVKLYLMIAAACLELDDVIEARRYIDEIEKLLRKETPCDDNALASVLVARGRQEFRNGQYDIALATAKEATRLVRDSRMMDDKYISALLQQAYIACLRDDDFTTARGLILDAQNVAKRCPIPFHAAVISVSGATGFVYTSLGDYDTAEEELRNAMSVTERMVGPRHWLYRELQMHYGILTARRGDPEEGYAILKDASRKHREIAGCDNIRYSNILIDLARVNITRGRLDDAVKELVDCKRLRDKKLRDGHPKRAEVSYELGAVYLTQRRYAEAEKLLVEAERIYLESLGETRPAYLRTLSSQIGLYRATNRESDAAKLETHLKVLAAK